MQPGQNILIGVSGSIAAYKVANLVRLFVKTGHNVQVIMTSSATDFITPLTLATLSKREVFVSFTNQDKTNWTNHVELGLWADKMIIAPASANTLAKMANGICDNLLLATYLSAKCPIYFAPAMDLDMWRHPSTLKNIATLKSYGNRMIPVGKGELASGLYGEGRMAEPEEILQFLDLYLEGRSNVLKGKKVLITAGPTHEPIDPVRFIGNKSTGKMGVAIANAFAINGAEVVLVKGPVSITSSVVGVEELQVTTAAEMYSASARLFPTVDIAIASAAVADFTPREVSSKKIKKSEGINAIALESTTDILSELGKCKADEQLLVGFALETNDEEANAISKLHRKNLDFIVLNSLQDKGAGFGYDTNKVSIIDKNESMISFDLKSKQEVALDIVKYTIKMLTERERATV